jgi:hypothetical protein
MGQRATDGGWACSRPRAGLGGIRTGHRVKEIGELTIGHGQGLPTGRCGSHRDAGWRAGDVTPQGASVGIEHRPARGAWSR